MGFDFVFGVDSRGHKGGLALFWKKDTNVSLIRYNDHCIDVRLNLGGAVWHFTGYYGHANRLERTQSWALIRALATKSGLPWLLMGDFNANPNHRLIKGFFEGELNTQQLIAVQEIDRSIYQQATMGGFKDRHHGMHLDYIFVSPEYEVLRTQIVKDNVNGRFPSDHYPLLADVCLI